MDEYKIFDIKRLYGVWLCGVMNIDGTCGEL